MATRRKDPDAIPNLGPASRRWLESVGLGTAAEIRGVGAIEAFRRVRRAYPEASRNLLYALHAGLQGRHWAALPPALKERLCEEAGIAPPRR